jgi:oxygen-independent coproporphyrinogen-3 oxidase
MQEDRLLDFVMLQLRLSDGLDLQAVQQQYGLQAVQSVVPTICALVAQGLMELVQQQSAPAPASIKTSSSPLTSGLRDTSAEAQAVENRQDYGNGPTVDVLTRRLQGGMPCPVRLTDPAGFLLSNDVIAELFAALTDGIPMAA